MADVYFRPDGQNRFQIRSAANGTLPSAWLDQEINRIYTYLNTIEGGGTTTGTEWATINAEGTKVSTTSFSLTGDYYAIFESLRAIRLTDESDVNTLSHIKSSTYVAGTNTTTVVVYDAIVPDTIKAISVGLIGSEASTIPSLTYTTRTSAYTVGAKDQVIFADDSTVGSLTLVYDDEQVNGDGYYALLINLPVASDVPGKILCVKKIGGTYRTIVSSGFTHTTTTDGTNVTHHNAYGFQIYGDTSAKNRVTLYGVGDCYWLFSNGSRWYELTPEASETVKGITRFATESEMSLTAQQIADEEELSKSLAVSPYQLDKAYLRSDASNISFASNYIYKAPNGVAALVNNNIVVYNGLGLSIPDGRSSDGVLKNEQIELANNLTYTPVEVTSNWKALFVNEDFTFTVALMRNCFEGYYMSASDLDPRTVNGDVIIWYDWTTNLLKYSTNRAANWSTLKACGPICYFNGNGTYTTGIHIKQPVGFLTRDYVINELEHRVQHCMEPNYSAITTIASHSGNAWTGYTRTAPSNGYVMAYARDRGDQAAMEFRVNNVVLLFGGRNGSYNTRTCMTAFVGAGQQYTVNLCANTVAYFVPCKGW